MTHEEAKRILVDYQTDLNTALSDEDGGFEEFKPLQEALSIAIKALDKPMDAAFGRLFEAVKHD
jgi:hypothetical protein